MTVSNTDTYTLWSSPLPDPLADLELRVQRLEAMRETEKAALLDAFRQNAHTQASQITQDFDIIRRAVEQLND